MATEPNVIPLTLEAKPRTAPGRAFRERFRVIPFTNAAGSQSWRVTGIKRDGTRIRENHADATKARNRQIELESEYLSRRDGESVLRETTLIPAQLRLAEAAFHVLDCDEDLVKAAHYWLKHGKAAQVVDSPRLDDAFTKFKLWLDSAEYRERTKANLRTRVNVFVNGTGNMRVAEVTSDTVKGFLDKRDVAKASKANDRRALSRFFAYCIEQKWTKANPARKETRERPRRGNRPKVLSVGECKALLLAAEADKNSCLAPYVAACLFGGLRPTEAARLDWSQVNLADGEILLDADQTKTNRPRKVSICPTLKAWLTAYKDKPFYPQNWRRDFDRLKEAAGYGGRHQSELRPWPVDVMRHTAISHYFRQTGSYGRTAEQFGNSEAIIKSHYDGTVSSKDTEAFYALLPSKGGAK